MKALAFTALTAAALLFVPAAAHAAPPPNDNRAAARGLGQPPVSVEGTTVDATREPLDPATPCGPVDRTVWYRLESPREARFIVRLRAEGDLDAVISIFRRQRAQLQFVTCAATNERGNAEFSFATADESTYLLMVAQRPLSPSGDFRLTILAPDRPATPPGAALPRAGATSSVDALLDPDDAWATPMRAGQTYRINLVTGRERCVNLALYRPGTRSFGDARPVRSASCGGYLTFTPGPDGGGLYTMLVTARSNSGESQYHLRAAKAGRDDTSPGLPLRNLETRRGSLAGREVDVVDLYRFQIGRRSDVVLSLGAGEQMELDFSLLTDTGRGVRCDCGSVGGARMRLKLRRGRYFLAVRSRRGSGGFYSVRLLVRDITGTGMAVNGVRRAVARPGQPVVLTARVTPPGFGGRVRFKIDRFDPFEGWVFARFVSAPVGPDGIARYTWYPPSVGRWRIGARFLGTLTRSPSRSGSASLLVAEPLP